MAQSRRPPNKVIPVFIVTAILVPLALFAGHRFLNMTFGSLFMRAPPEKKFMDAWSADLKHLEKIKALHPGFNDLKSVRLISPSETLKKSYREYPLDLGFKPNGHYVLEIFMDEIEGGGVVVQYDLIDKKSGNTVWELGRTFPHKIH